MRCLKRNMTAFEYYPYAGTETDVNDAGEHTGEFYPEYEDPSLFYGNISTPSGSANQTFYGEDLRYTHTLVMKNDANGIAENGLILWNEEWYDVIAVRPSINFVTIALRKRTTDNAPEPGEGPDGEEPWEEPGDEPGDEPPDEGEGG